MATTQSPEWMPSGTATQLPCGRWWDAVLLSMVVAQDTVTALRERDHLSGTIWDGIRGCVTWLIPPGAAAAWHPLPGVQVLGRDASVHVPPADWCPSSSSPGPAIRWLIRPYGSGLARAEEVHRALQDTLFPQRALQGGGPRG